MTAPAAPRRHFRLPAEDEEFLDEYHAGWEAIVEGGLQWILVHGFTPPAGYTQRTHTLGVLVTPGYPTLGLDMIYVSPRLEPLFHRSIAGLSEQPLDGMSFQRWSRHYTDANPWRAGEFNIGTHLRSATSWFEREVVLSGWRLL